MRSVNFDLIHGLPAQTPERFARTVDQVIALRPERIAPAVDAALAEVQGRYDPVFVAYADCGSGGELDRVLARYPGVQRLPGAHCYDVFAGAARIGQWLEEAPGTFLLTDFLVRHFDRLVIRGLGLDRHPELLPMYFGHYARVLYLAQVDDPELQARARAAASRLGLAFDCRWTGYGGLDAVRVRFQTPRRVA